MRCMHTAAFVNPSRKYKGKQTQNFAMDPEQTEYLFKKNRSQDIPSDYIDVFEEHMCLVHEHACEGLDTDIYSDVLYTHVLVSNHARRIILLSIKTRPCAEKFGFYRLFLLQLCRTACLLHFSLHIFSPTEECQEVLQRSFGKREMLYVEFECDSRQDEYEAGVKYPRYVLSEEDMKTADMKLNVAQEKTVSFSPQMKLVRRLFPQAFEMNTGDFQRIHAIRRLHLDHLSYTGTLEIEERAKHLQPWFAPLTYKYRDELPHDELPPFFDPDDAAED